MTSKNDVCTIVQENIAWGRALSIPDQKHVLICPKCSKVAIAFEEVDSAVNKFTSDVPTDFADRVMAKIIAREKSEPKFLENFKDIFAVLINHQVFRWGIGGTSFLIAFAAH